MKILHCAETIKGGVATVMKQIIAAQINSPECEKVICLIPDSQREELNEISEKNISTFHRTGRNIFSLLNLTVKFFFLLLREKPDVVHLHSTFSGFFARLVLILLMPIRRPKVIYCPHAFSFLMENSAIKQRIYIYIERFFSLVTDSIICVSDYERMKAINCGLKETKLIVIHNGVPPHASEHAKHQRVNLNLLFVGRLDFQKGYDVLIEAMRQIHDPTIHLTIVGDSVTKETQKILLDNVTYTGWLKSAELESHFINSDALIIPSRWEGFAMVPLEAMSYSLPIVSSDSTSLPEVVKDGETGFLFENGNADELREKILSLKNIDLKVMGANGNRLFRDKFTSESMIEKTNKLYQEIFLR
ncbi:glycosyltransferase [[Pantoea] beijingensis]|nr:glycosyltransferase [[Pantoea] beijingensis]